MPIGLIGGKWLIILELFAYFSINVPLIVNLFSLDVV